jgi:hypothetical protein
LGADQHLGPRHRSPLRQITRNGVPDDDGPEFWITPPSYPVYRYEHELAAAISRVSGVEPEFVEHAMTAGVDLVAGRPFTMPAQVPAPATRLRPEG